MPTLPECKPEQKVTFKDYLSDVWFIIVRTFQIVYFMTIGMIIFAFVLIAIEAAFTSKELIDIFKK
jgi:hypothetical protein